MKFFALNDNGKKMEVVPLKAETLDDAAKELSQLENDLDSTIIDARLMSECELMELGGEIMTILFKRLFAHPYAHPPRT